LLGGDGEIEAWRNLYEETVNGERQSEALGALDPFTFKLCVVHKLAQVRHSLAPSSCRIVSFDRKIQMGLPGKQWPSLCQSTYRRHGATHSQTQAERRISLAQPEGARELHVANADAPTWRMPRLEVAKLIQHLYGRKCLALGLELINYLGRHNGQIVGTILIALSSCSPLLLLFQSPTKI
jgi:hypothetical protein